MAAVMCHENELLYVLAFYPRGLHEPLFQFQGWGCAGEVQVTLDGSPLSPVQGRSCSLLKLVRTLAPASASGTRDAAEGCSRMG
jgi:hypothetical protein